MSPKREKTVRQRQRRRRTVLHAEAIDRALRELENIARAAVEDLGTPELAVTFESPGLDDELTTRLRRVLESEIVPAVEPPEPSQILEHELHHEVMKKALVGLKAASLRKIAKRDRVESSGNLEELATRIGQYYGWDSARIAHLVLEAEEEPTVERGYSDRLFPLEVDPDLDYVGGRLDYVLGRYIRIGIAKWFVFEDLEELDEEIRVTGTLRSYRATVTGDSEKARVDAVEAEDHSIDLYIDASRIIRVRNANGIEASAGVRALAEATKLRPIGYVEPKVAGITGGPALAFASASLFMIDLLTERMHSAGLYKRDLTVARFRMTDQPAAAGSTAPNLRAMRFEGTQILDSPAACKLIDDGRPLVDVALTVQPPPRRDGDTGRLPVRVAIERDHVLAMTGFGLFPELSPEVHRQLVTAVRREMTDGIANPGRVMGLARRIVDRAGQVAVAEADMLSDDPSDW